MVRVGWSAKALQFLATPALHPPDGNRWLDWEEGRDRT